jgi:hypothetical protein
VRSLKNVGGSNSYTVTAAVGETIDFASAAQVAPGGYLELKSYGAANWMIVGRV